MNVKEILKDARLSHGFTMKELAEEVGVSEATISRWESGNIENMKRDKIASVCKILNIHPSVIMGWDDNVIPFKRTKCEYTEIDVLGSVPAGTPTEAMEDVVGQVDIPSSWLDCGDQYRALKVKGDSMYPMYIEGDTVILRIQPDCHNRQDAVVFVNGYDATLKKVIKNDDGTITLKAINPEWQSKTYGPGDEEIKIFGVVVELRRGF
ncbi:repressor LexA [Eubacterium aggregans]|uniref:Repressor LexA n=1 Tax=Eubacterium aggregans TaxID=81409 RepID=A0A1H3XZU5_9FIRM|nr:XRE family transcriptional regulator [Eubacterium aggregans]SEA04977.1 repressor LexA [Eubacterium aggregans]